MKRLSKFALVGGLGFLVEFIIFNTWMLITRGGPLIANVVSITAAILFNWAGNRKFTFEKTSKSKWLELYQFVLASLAGLMISTGLLWLTYYQIDLAASGLFAYAEDIFINNFGLTEYDYKLFENNLVKFVGLILGFAVKFLLYKHWVFKDAK